MGQLTFALRDEAIAALRKDYDAFVRMTTRMDPRFVTPSFDDFLRARIMDNTVPLTEQAVSHLLNGSHYAWAKRTLDKDFPDVVAILMRQAAEFGFGFAVRSEWSNDELLAAARDFARAVVAESGANAQDAQVVDMLATQIKNAAQDIQTLEEKMQTPAWRLLDSMRERVYDAKLACENATGSAARDRLGQLRALLKLSLVTGTMQRQEAQQILEYLQILKPEIFVDEPDDIFSRFAAWLRAIFLPPRPAQPSAGSAAARGGKAAGERNINSTSF